MKVDDLRMFGDRLLVRPDPRPDESPGGIILPELQRDANPNYYTMTGTVVAVGDGVRFDVWECLNHQCRYRSRRTAGEYCPICKATQALAFYGDERQALDVVPGDRIVYGRFAGKQIELHEATPKGRGSFCADCPADGRCMDACYRLRETARYLIMREVEVIGVVPEGVTVMPGYEEAKWSKPTKGLTV